jgi:hypothetical protein
MDTGTKWERRNAGQHARVHSMAGITYFVALPFDVADGSIVVGDPCEALSRIDGRLAMVRIAVAVAIVGVAVLGDGRMASRLRTFEPCAF